jgi:hypothetical protein
MSSAERISSISLAVPAALLAAGLVLAGWILGAEIKTARYGDRYVTVKGLVERQVKSDFAIWPVTLQETGDDLQSVTTRAQTDQHAILSFFEAQGFSAAEVEAGVIQVIDTQVDQNGGSKPPHRFVVRQTLTLTTAKVEAATKASQQALNLLKAGIVLMTESSYGQNGGIRYIFNGLNAIKPDMITEATRNARSAADRFAADSGSKVGSIRQAEQGVFSISAANGDSPAGPEGAFGGSDTSSPMKKVRVVTTVQYYLER